MRITDILHHAFQAAQSGDARRLKIILESEPHLANSENEDGMKLLGYASHFGNFEVVQLLIDYGAEVNAISCSKVSYIPSNTALHSAIAGERNADVIRLLLQHQSDPNILDSNGHSALHTAAFHDDNQEIIHLLLEYGADVHAKIESGETPFSLAVQQGNMQVAELLRRLEA
ncbi:ankyrin repeat domain-containing protein [Paenibacillus pinihumi]|uniref:ankyrin repeat domain-containing protein n=1 Tax=Paenibacillus pinihumi TaxID=669462 RepID=UPI0004251D6B|nr:ankyrin repeat domain-containing protein [Paenibacillus pinihumi]